MDDTMLTVKFVEVLIMEGLVFAAVIALLIAGVRDVVEAKVRESRRREQIESQLPEQTPVVGQPVADELFAGQLARP
jgi:Na+-translocating ferredoxin:NAD+ oxidoreductase RnfG subunit